MTDYWRSKQSHLLTNNDLRLDAFDRGSVGLIEFSRKRIEYSENLLPRKGCRDLPGRRGASPLAEQSYRLFESLAHHATKKLNFQFE